MTSAMPARTPFATGTQLSVNPKPPSKEDPDFVISYQGLVGSLMYAILGTRPDISYAITKLSQFLSNLTQEHFKASKHVLHYLKNMMHLHLCFGSIDDSEVTRFSDSD
jgi:hypothetical protein